jgi:ATP-binding cassette subfamily B (MDR/TAP) protein 1
MLLGIVTSIIAGAGEPVQCIILAQTVATLALPPSQYQKLRSDANFWSGMFLMIALVMLVCYLVLGISFAYGSERLIRRSRDQAFRSILRQDIAFFDRSDNSVGALTSFISTETTHLAGRLLHNSCERMKG